MTTEPKLLTEAEARAIYIAATSPDDFNARLRERGLIAPEPVDPLLVEARALADNWWPYEGALIGSMDGSMWMIRILTAIRRGIELQREAAPLTREDMGKAYDAACKAHSTSFRSTLLDALTEQVRK